MAAPLSQDLRRRLVQAVEQGSSAREAARRLAVSGSAAIKLIRRVRETGSAEPTRIGGYRKPLLAGDERAAEQDRPDVAEHRRMRRVWQRFVDPDCFVFLDETGASTNMVRRYGWAPRSERLVAAAPHGRWRTTTFVAGLRSTGLVAPLVLDGPMTGPAFLAYIERFLAPTLRPGDVVVMDNLAARKGAGVEAAIRAAGASLPYLPPYSPDLNPIEQVFAKLKALLRRAAARTREALWSTIGQLLGRLSPAEGRNHLANSEYQFT